MMELSINAIDFGDLASRQSLKDPDPHTSTSPAVETIVDVRVGPVALSGSRHGEPS